MASHQDSTVPKSQPIKSFKDLLAWQPGQDEYNVANTPFHPRPPVLDRQAGCAGGSYDPITEKKMTPGLKQEGRRACKVIACHDMAGGYTQDALPQGSNDSNIYSIQYWSHIDTFIYFSHYRISIPPPVWTNAAHRNGVRSVGTIITEWLPGILETDEMVSGPDQALADENGIDTVDRRWFSRTYADKLVDLAMYYKFDGWFINIESILRGGPEQATQTIAFLGYLREQIHARIPGGELIWYDSVVSSTGEVAWQDKLSLENYRFFEKSDGIFTNYTWKEHAVGESVALAGPRKRDVYTGIDVWGRNTFGGGGYTTYKALEVIQREQSSCALFAPAWTYESLGKDTFMTSDRLFWVGIDGAGIHAESLPLSTFYALTRRLLTKKPTVECKDGDGDGDGNEDRDFLPVSAYIPARPSGCSSWFYTNFDRGFGKGFWVNGKKVSAKQWSHLSHQSLSPTLTKEVFMVDQNFKIQIQPAAPKAIRWVVSPEDAYHGGTSLVIQEFSLDNPASLPPILTPPPPKPPGTDTKMSADDNLSTARSTAMIIPLFDIQISLLAAQSSVVELVFKPLHDNVEVGIHLGVLAIGKDTNKDEEIGKDQFDASRKISLQEFSQLLQPEVRKKTRKYTPGRLTLVTLDSAAMSGDMETGIACTSMPEESDSMYSVETLGEGWQRLTLHLSSLWGHLKPSPITADEYRRSLATLALSQLGVTLNYNARASMSPLQAERLQPLVVLGSMSVMPAENVRHKKSHVLGIKTSDNKIDMIERPRQGGSKTSADPNPGDKMNESWLRISSTISWNIGFSVASLAEGALKDQPSPIEYSHFCIYISMSRKKPATGVARKEKEDEQEELIFVGTAFAHRYRISNFEIPWGGVEKAKASVMQRPLTAPNFLGDNECALWVWVQGIRRDGRAGAMQDPVKMQLF
ncbi:hypothetical protein BG011_006426 [Mortierella polycephala]|uniref:Cytosolic endo-beta-N-acetylglucosaminidase TIM barrel domain-containing protein n=1 Tax=Mortierella polycephala TaxID=41804 RepID=A0A9P6TZ06_9FUNG|nr:hypothetical protein BG011_006426 [Mortierella polycephala]